MKFHEINKALTAFMWLLIHYISAVWIKIF